MPLHGSINIKGREGIHNLKFDADWVASLAKYLTKHSMDYQIFKVFGCFPRFLGLRNLWKFLSTYWCTFTHELAHYLCTLNHILNKHTIKGQEVGHLRLKGSWARMHFCFGLIDCVKLGTSDLTCWADTQEVKNISQPSCVGWFPTWYMILEIPRKLATREFSKPLHLQ